jgi:hypothetical protein
LIKKTYVKTKTTTIKIYTINNLPNYVTMTIVPKRFTNKYSYTKYTQMVELN